MSVTINGSGTITSSTGAVGFDNENLSTTGTVTGSLVGTGTANIQSGVFIGGSASANLLNDYEEGSWTPVLSGASSTTYTAQSGDYVKVGELVFVNCSLQINSVGDGSTTTIAGLPYTSLMAGSATAGGAVSYFANSATNTLAVSPEMGDGATTVRFRSITSSTSGMSGYLAMFQNSTRVDFHLCYRAT